MKTVVLSISIRTALYSRVMQRARPRRSATLTVEEAAGLLGISRGLAYEAARTGQLPTIRIGHRILVPRARLLELLGEENDTDQAS